MSRSGEDTTYLTLAEAAARLGTTVTRVLMLIKKGALRGKELGEEWLVEVNSVAGCNLRANDEQPRSCISHCTAKGCGCA